jgi:hypothetical protein
MAICCGSWCYPRAHLRPWQPDTEQTRLLQHLVAARRQLVNEKARQVQRLTDKPKLYFPQALDWFEKVDSPLVGALLLRLAHAGRAAKSPAGDPALLSYPAQLPQPGID